MGNEYSAIVVGRGFAGARRWWNLNPAICEAPPGVHLASALGFAVGGLKK
jgi:hypothetical protein